MPEETRAAQIERAIREIAELDVVVEESEGTILLEGIVDSERDRQAAEDIAADLSGGLTIDNALEVQDTFPVSVDSFNDEQRSADATELTAHDRDERLKLDPDFTDQVLTDDPRVVGGPSSGAGDEPDLDDGGHAYVPPIDPVSKLDDEGQEIVVGGFGISALDADLLESAGADVGFGDEAIADAVRRELLADAATTDLPIRVVVRDGIVYLHGTVTDLADADAAEGVAARIQGVREVRDATDIADTV